MLAQQHRMRTKVQFTETTRSGVRSGRRNLVLYAVKTDDTKPTIAGFIVSKAVGNAVVRNKTKRRLRELAAQTIAEAPTGYSIAVRALPASANASWDQLSADYKAAMTAVLAKLAKHSKTQAVAESPDAASQTPREES